MTRKSLVVAYITVLILIFVVGMWPRDGLVVASEIEVLIQPYADAFGPPTAITFSGADLYVWWGDNALVLKRNEHWYLAGITERRESTVPPLFVALVIQTIREKQRQGTWNVRPIAPWSVTAAMPEEALHPEER